jgi:hypothetical protein
MLNMFTILGETERALEKHEICLIDRLKLGGDHGSTEAFDQKAALQLSNSPTARSLKQSAMEAFLTCGWQTEEIQKPSQSLSQATEASGTKKQRMPCPQSRRVRVTKKTLKVS